MPKINEVCRDCLKWEKFGKSCWVHWDEKQECTQKIISEDEWDQIL